MMASTLEASQHSTFSIKLWPPSQSTRVLVVEKMMKNMSTPSIFSRMHGLLTVEEAEEVAKVIEEDAFASASRHYEHKPDGDGSSAVQFYAKESSKLMLDVLKRGPKLREGDGDAAPMPTFLDISDGRRAFIDGAEVEELLRPLSEPGNRYSRIRLSNRSFGREAASAAVPVLSRLGRQLTDVDLSDFIAGRSEDEALEVMSAFASALAGCELRRLDLSDNALGEKGVRAFGPLLGSQSGLEELYLVNDGISEEAACAVSDLIPSTRKLRVLHFHNNMTGDGAFAIAGLVDRSPFLEDFRCSSTRIETDAGIFLVRSLARCDGLRRLDLRDNMFGTEVGIELGRSIPLFPRLTELYLSYLNLEDEGGTAVADALMISHAPLEVLEMAGNGLTAAAASSVVAYLVSRCLPLVRLNLSENEMRDDGALVLAKAFADSVPCLKEVDLGTNGIRRAGAVAVARAVLHKPGFRLLDINGNFVSEEGIDQVREMFKHCSDVLGPLDDNDPEGEDAESDENPSGDEGDDVDDDDDAADELHHEIKRLDLKGKSEEDAQAYS